MVSATLMCATPAAIAASVLIAGAILMALQWCRVASTEVNGIVIIMTKANASTCWFVSGSS
jgi:hypothetical protein